MTRCTVITAIVGLIAITAAPADAVVYCKTVGVPQGCVARPGAAAVEGGVCGGGLVQLRIAGRSKVSLPNFSVRISRMINSAVLS